MKVVLINTSERRGGAAIACNRLTQALCKAGVEARMLVATADTNKVNGYCNTTWKRRRYKWAFLWERLGIFIHNGFSRKNLFAVSTASDGLDIASHPALKDADVIHLHWVNQGFLSLAGLQRILSLGKPVVWTMHDMWAVTGICHHARTCTGYTQSCGNCMFLNSHNAKDLSHLTFNKKQRCYGTAPIHFVTCSAWLRKLAEKSALIKPSDSVRNIPNPIDTDFFCPGNKGDARLSLGLPSDKKLILFGAVNAADKRKGIDYFIETLNILHKDYSELNDSIQLVVFGNTGNMPLDSLPYPCTSLGYVSDSDKIRAMYRAVDAYVTPSLEENLPNTIMEAMACATPCVGFEIGGIPEMIDADNGYVARYKDANDMAAGIAKVLHNDNNSDMGIAARQKVLNEYSEESVAQRYTALYQSIQSK